MADSSDNSKYNTADGLAAVAAGTGAVATSQLLYRPGGMEKKMNAAHEKVAEARKALDERVALGANGKTPTPQEAAKYVRLQQARATAAEARADYQSAVKGFEVDHGYTPKEVKKVLEDTYSEVQRADKEVTRASESVHFGLFGLKKEFKSEGRKVWNAKDVVADLSRIESANAKKGLLAALKRPFTILRHGSGSAKLAVIGGTVVAGGIAYVGTRVAQEYAEAKANSVSFAEREQMRQQAAAMADPNIRNV